MFMNTPSVTSSGNRARFPSSPWAWFGAQVGATLWLVRAAWLLGPRAPRETLLAVLICFAVPNLIGLALWFRWRQVGEWAAFRSVLIAITVCTFIAMSRLRHTPEFAAELPAIAFIAVAAVLAAMFLLLHHRATHNQNASS
jgi:hypothetical protein